MSAKIFPFFFLGLFSICFGQTKKEQKIKEIRDLSALAETWSKGEGANNDSAIYYATKAINIFPEYASQAYKTRGICYYYKKEYTKAIADLSTTITLEQKEGLGEYLDNEHYWRGLAYRANQQYDKSIDDLTLAIKSDTDYYNYYKERGGSYKLKGDINKAIADFSQSIRLLPDDADAFMQRAKSYIVLKDTSAAIRDFSQAVSLTPSSEYTLVERADFFEKLKMKDKAYADYTAAIKLAPANEYTYTRRAHFFWDQRDLEKASLDFDEAIRITPYDIVTLSNKAILYLDMGKYIAALSESDKVLSLNPRYVTAIHTKLYAQEALGDYLSAISTCRYGTQIDSKFYQGHMVRLYIWLNDIASAQIYLKPEVTSDLLPGNYRRYYYEAISLAGSDNSLPDALINLNKAENLFFKDSANTGKYYVATNYLNLLSFKGFLLEKLGNKSEATNAYTRALSYSDNLPGVTAALERLNKKSNDADKTPPLIQLISPDEIGVLDIKSEDQLVQVIGKARDASGIQLIRINDQVVKAEEDGIFVSLVSLKSGVNKIRIEAVDKNNNKAIKTVSISASIGVEKSNSHFANSKVNYYAILIAEENYSDRNIPRLSNPVKDARDLRSILMTYYNFPVENIDTIYNGATREEICNRIKARCAGLGENDNLLIFYAGHAVALGNKSGGYDGYLIPTGAKKGNQFSYISANDITTILKNCDARHILFIADACYSGALARDLPPDAQRSIQRLYNYKSRTIMTSGNLEPVPDESKFIYFLKNELINNTEKYAAASDIFDGFKKAVRNNTENLPLYTALYNVGDEGGDFIFTKTFIKNP